MNRYIAFLDILGFADLVKEEPLGVVKTRVQRALDWADAAVKAAPHIGIAGQNVRRVHHFSFSDTFVLLSEDDSVAAFLSFLNATTVLTRALFAQKLPVRGTITFGEADFIPGTHHAVGKGIITAAEFEKYQDWIGVTVLEETIPAEGQRLMADVLFEPVLIRWDVPVKPKLGSADDAVLRNRLVVNWLYNVRVNFAPEAIFRPTNDPGAKRKIEHSLLFARQIYEDGRNKGRNFHLNAQGDRIFTPSLADLGTAESYYGK